MRSLARLILLILLVAIIVVLVHYANLYSHQTNPDNGKVMLLFGGVVLVGIVTGAVAAFMVVPMIGEMIGGLFFNPAEEAERDPHMKALALSAQGDYEGALEEYFRLLEETPGDTIAINEVVKIYCDRFHAPENAAQFLEGMLTEEHEPDLAALLINKLADVYWKHLNEPVRARDILIQLAESLPDTRHAANARHRLNEIDQSLHD